MLLPIHVQDADGKDVFDADVRVRHWAGAFQESKDLPLRKSNNRVAAVLNLNSPALQEHFALHATAVCPDGRIAAKWLVHEGARQACSSGVSLTVWKPSRTVRFTVTNGGTLVAGVLVKASFSTLGKLTATTAADGIAEFDVLENDTLQTVSALAADGRVGGFQTTRKPIRDPKSDQFEIELIDSVTKQVQLVDSTTGKRVGLGARRIHSLARRADIFRLPRHQNGSRRWVRGEVDGNSPEVHY